MMNNTAKGNCLGRRGSWTQIATWALVCVALGALVPCMALAQGTNPLEESDGQSPQVDLAVDKVAISGDCFVVGETVTYRITVRNLGPGDATEVLVVDELPEEVEFVDVSPSSNCTMVDGVLMCLFPSIPAGQSEEIILTVLVVEEPTCISDEDPGRLVTIHQGAWGATPNGMNAGVYLHANFAAAFPGGVTIGGGDCGGFTAQFTSAMAVTNFLPASGATGDLGGSSVNPLETDGGQFAGHVLALALNVGFDLYDPDFAPSDFNLVDMVVCKGRSAVVGMTVGEILHEANNILAGCTSSFSIEEMDGTVTEINGNFPNGLVNNGLLCVPGTDCELCNTVCVSAAEHDNNMSNNCDEICLPPCNRESDIEVEKSASVSVAAQGETFTYTIVVTNNGPDESRNVVLGDDVPSELEILNVTASQGSCTVSGNQINCTLGQLDPGASAVVTIVVRNDNTGDDTEVCNVAAAAAFDSTDPNPDNNSDEACTILRGEPDVNLVVEKTPSVDAAEVGDTIVYTITVENTGTDTATDVVVVDTLPPEVVYVSATSTAGTCTHTAGVVTCEIASLAAGAMETITITVTAAEETECALNVVAAGSDEPDSDPSDNEDEVCVVITETVIDISVEKTVNEDQVVEQNLLLYTVVVSNVGDNTATAVVVTDELPVEVEFVSAEATQGTCSESSGVLTCELGDLATGESATIEILVIARTPAVEVCNTAEAGANESDENPGDNTSEVCVTINAEPSADLEIVKTDAFDPMPRGNIQIYTIQVTNLGPDPAQGVIVTDPIPEHLTYLGAESESGPATFDSGVLTVDLGTMQPGDMAKILIAAMVEITAPNLVANTATVSALTQDPEQINDSATEETVIFTENPNAMPSAAWILSHILGEVTLTGDDLDLHDVNGDGVVDVADLNDILSD